VCVCVCVCVCSLKWRGAYKDLVGKPEEIRPLAIPRPRWADNIRIVLQEVAWGMDWIDTAQMVGSCEYGNGPQNTGNCLNNQGLVRFSRRTLPHLVS